MTTAKPSPAARTTALGFTRIEDLGTQPFPLFVPTPTLRRVPASMTLVRDRWIFGARIDKQGRTDVIGAYLLAAGVPEQELRECAHLWPWSSWSRQVDVLGRHCVQANALAQQWSLRASQAEAQMRETAERNAAQLEHQLVNLLAQHGVGLSITGALAPVH